MLRHVATVFSLLCLLSQSGVAKEAVRWERLYTEHGITVSAGHRDGADLPMLKGVGVLPVNLYHLLAIVEDVKRHNEWVYRVARAEIVERPSLLKLRAYLRFDFPWPANDRDGVVNVDVKRTWTPHHQVSIRFSRTVDRRRPEYDGVVRVPWSKGATRLRWIGPNQTHVEYMIDTDPGGLLPKWLVRWISRDLPLKILKGLHRQVTATRRDYGAFFDIWDPRRTWQPDSPQSFSLLGVAPDNLAPPPPRPSLPSERELTDAP